MCGIATNVISFNIYSSSCGLPSADERNIATFPGLSTTLCYS